MRSFIVGCLTLLVMSGCSATVSDDTVTLLPLPREVVWNKGVFDSRSVSLSGDFSVTGAVREWLEESGIESSGTASAVVEVALVDRIDKAAVNQDDCRAEIHPCGGGFGKRCVLGCPDAAATG